MKIRNTRKEAAVVCATVFALLLGAVSLVRAQGAGTGSISGTVQDPKGLAVPGAQVVVRNVDTAAERVLTTNEAGLYAAPYLQPGRYEIRVKKEGFAEVIRQNLTLEVGQVLAVDVDLPLKATQQTVTVTAEAGRIETEKIDVSQTVAQYQVENLPLNGRNWTNLVLQTPGVSEDGGFGLVSFRGISALYNNNTVDGADNNQAFFSEARGRTRLPYVYSLDAIKEFNVETGAYSAEFGRAAGGIVNAVTKSGTNSYHGDGFYFIRDDLWLARDPIANAGGQPKPDERRQQFGGSFGGPVIGEKLFFFLNYDQQKRNFPAVVTGSAPDTFKKQLTTCTADTANVTVAECNSVFNAINSVANATDPRKGNNYIGLAKMDYQLNANNRISGVVNILRWDSPNGIQTGPVINVSHLANGTDGVHDQFVTGSWNSVLTPSVVNEVRFQYGEDFLFQTANQSGPSFGFSSFSIGGADFGMPNFLPRGKFPDEFRYQWVDNLSWVRGRHQFKAGLDINHVHDDIQNLFQGGGVYSYPNSTSLAPSCAANCALDFLVRDIFNGTTRSYSTFVQAIDPITGSGKGSFTTNDYNFYFQDNIKLRPSFTLNMGLRYEVQVMPEIVQANPLVPESGKLNTDTNNFAPRVGFAWDIRGRQKEVIRSGYGIYYGRTQNSTLFTHLFQNGVFQQTFTVRPSQGAACAPLVPNTLFPQPSTAPAFGPIFGSSGPTPTATYASLAAFQAACASAGGAATVDVLDPHFVNPLVHEYDVTYEEALPWSLDLSVSYLGSRANHLPIFYDVNLPPPDTAKTYLVFDTKGNPVGPTQFTVPFFSGVATRPRSGLGTVLMGKSIVNSWYNGLVLRLRRREIHGFSFDANFTYSKSIDDGQVMGTNGTFTGTDSPLNPFDIRAEYGPSELDIRKRFVMNFYWVAPFANWTQNRGVKALIGGWKFSSVIRAQDGRPVTAFMGSSPSCSSRADFGLTCGAVSANAGFTNGRVPFIERNGGGFLTPGLFTVDLRVNREFKITERASFETFAEAFNLFNRTNGLTVNNTAFGFASPSPEPTTANPNPPRTFCPRVSDVSATIPNFKGCVQQSAPFLTVRTTANTLYTARQLQIGGRFRF